MWPCRLGQAQLHLEAVKDARSSLQRAGERLQKAEKAMDPPNPPAEAEVRTWVGYGTLGARQLLQGDYEGALEKLSQAARVSSQASTHLFQALTLHLLGRDPSGALRTARLFEPRLVEVAHRSLPALPSRLQQEVETLLAGSGSVAQSGYPRTGVYWKWQPAESGKAAEDDFKVGQKIEVYSKSGGRWFPAEIIQAEAETVKVRYYMVDEKQLSGTSVAYEKLLLRNSENLRRTAETKIEEVAEKGIDADSSKVRGVFSKKEVQEEPQKLLLNSEDLKIDKVLGSGGFGAVYRGTYLGQEVAIKKLHLIDGQVSSEQVAEFKKEVMNLQALRHPRLVSFIGAALAVPSLMIVTEFMPNGSLYEALHQRKPARVARVAIERNAWPWPSPLLRVFLHQPLHHLRALGGVLFVFAALFSFVAIPRAGLATAQAVWSCSAILVSFAWGAIGPAEVAAPVGNIPATLLAVALLVAGALVIVNCDSIAGRLSGNPQSQQSESQEAAGSDKAAGISSALAVGLFGGSVLVPFKYIPPDVAGLAAIPSFGIGALVAGVIVTFGLLGLTGLASGLLWNAGNVASVIAQSPPFLLPYGVAYPILQLKMEHNQRNKIATQVSEGVSFLHGRAPPFVHRDLKSMNVVMDFDLNAKLCDFGLTQSMEKTHISRRDNEGGSPRYMAPELFDSRGKITEKVDVWALGCLVVEVISSRLPHEECTSIQQVMTRLICSV
eukprot:g3305.t1